MRQRAVFTNNMAIAGWIFMIVWLGGLCLISWVFVRDGGFHQFHPLLEIGIILMFWLFGIGGGSQMFSQPCVRLNVEGRHAILRQRWPWRVREDRFPTSKLAALPVKVEKDSDGDPYFVCVVTTPNGRTIRVGESHDRSRADALHERLATALRPGA